MLGFGALAVTGLMFWAVVREKSENKLSGRMEWRKVGKAYAIPAGSFDDYNDDNSYDLEVED